MEKNCNIKPEIKSMNFWHFVCGSFPPRVSLPRRFSLHATSTLLRLAYCLVIIVVDVGLLRARFSPSSKPQHKHTNGSLSIPFFSFGSFPLHNNNPTDVLLQFNTSTSTCWNLRLFLFGLFFSFRCVWLIFWPPRKTTEKTFWLTCSGTFEFINS